MSRITHDFSISRVVDGEDVEFDLKAEFEIEPPVAGFVTGRPEDCFPSSDGYAELIGEICLADDDVPWNGTLTKREKDKLESDVYEGWLDRSEPSSPNNRNFDDDSCFVGAEFDDFFDDDMAIKIQNRGDAYY
jgi:hypothetical protein